MGFLDRLIDRATNADRYRSVTNTAYVVVDTELTGLNERRDSIVSIGAIRMTGGRIDLSNTFYRLVRPEKALTAASVVIHEITPSDVFLKPDIDTVLAEFLNYCGKDIVLGHCLCIDLGFINREMKRISGSPLPNPALDTFSLFEWLKRRMADHRYFENPLRDFRLYEMAKCFGIPVQGAHNALMDAFITAQLFQRFIPLLLESGIQNIGDLLRIGDPLKGGGGYRIVGETINF